MCVSFSGLSGYSVLNLGAKLHLNTLDWIRGEPTCWAALRSWRRFMLLIWDQFQIKTLPSFNWSPVLGVCQEQHLCAAGASSNQHLLKFISTLSVLGMTQCTLPHQQHDLLPGNLETLDPEPSCMLH